MKRIFSTLVTLLLLSSTSLFAQHPNLITNGDFDNTTFDYQTISDYTRITGGAVEAGEFIHEVTSTGHGSGSLVGWPPNLYGYGGSGYYLLFNGFGNGIGNGVNATKAAWRQTVTVTSNTIYTFSAQVRNLSQPYMGISHNPAILRLKINNQWVSENYTLPTGHDWQEWQVTWNSGSATQALIEIYDVYNSNPGYGDDYGLDHIIFKLHDDYSLSATDFSVQYCGEITPIDLTGHYTMTYPSGGNSAPPMQVKIRYHGSDPWETSITTGHGTAYVGNDNKIYYTPNAGYYGSDYLRYQISRFGLESQRTININVMDDPSNCTPHGLPENDHLCLGSVSSFNPSASWSSNGSAITNPGWQWKKNGVTGWQNSSSFVSYVQGQGSVGEYSIKFLATNDCGSVESEPYLFVVCDVPVITPPSVTTVCTGSAEPTVSVNMNFNVGGQTWQYKRGNGGWTDFDWGQFDLQPGDQVRYRVTWDYCGGSPWTSPNVINVVSGPEFNSNIPVTFDEGYCPNSSVTLPTIQSSWYNAYGMSVTSKWYYVVNNPSGSPEYTPINGNTITLNNSSVSVTPGLQNTECGFTPYYPAFDLVVWDAPAIQGLENLPDSFGPYCSGETTLSSVLPELSPDGHYSDYGWEISAGQNPSNFQSNLPQTLSLSDNGRWLRYRVQKACTAHTDAISDPIRIWVGDKPTLNVGVIEPFGTVCAGTLVTSLADVHVTNWNLFHDDESFERWEVLLNGTWTAFVQFEMSYNGCQIQYHAHNQCGDVIVEAGIIHVTEGPSFNNPGAPLEFNSYYCDGEFLTTPTHPDYNNHGINVNDEYWAYYDGTEYHRITSSPQLDESWNDYQITYVLESDCGGEIYYPTPFVLTVKGQPVVEEVSLDGAFYCEGDPMILNESIDWHLCTSNNQSSWQYAPVNQSTNYIDFDPNFGIPEAGEYFINYHAVANECGFDAYCNRPIHVTINAAPEFEHPEQPFELGRFCEDDLLVLPSTPSVTGYIGEATWLISVGPESNGDYEEIEPNYHLSINDNGRWLRYYAIGCNIPIHYEEEIHVDGKPYEEYGMADRICKGQTLSCWLENSNDYPVTQREWRIGSTTGDLFNPDEYIFDVEGDYLIYYRVGNDCGWSEYLGPLPLSVTAGPEFNNSTLPNGPQYVCEGTTVGEFLQQLGITEPSLIDPSIPHNPLGWYINDQHVELNTIIVEGFHGAGLSYGVSGDCSDVPVYSSSILLQVYGSPEVTQMPTIDWEFCDGDIVQLPNPEIDYHNGEGHVNGYWQMQSPDGSWGDLPTNWSPIHDGMQIRYHLEHTVCPEFSNDSWEMTVIVYVAPDINDDDLPTNVSLMFCSGGSLGISDPYVDWHQNSPGGSGWQVSANGQDWSTELEGHVFDPVNMDDFFDGKYLRYHAASEQCPNLEDNSNVYSIQLKDKIEKPIDMEVCESFVLPDGQTVTEGGQWSYIIPSPDGCDTIVNLNVAFIQTDTLTDEPFSACNSYTFHGITYTPGYYEIYHDTVYASDGCVKTIHLLNLTVKDSEQMGTISGLSSVYVASNLISGVYRYEIDREGLEGAVTWSLSNPDWIIVESGDDFCQIIVTTPGMAILTAKFNVAVCGEMEQSFEIHAGFFGVDEQAMEVNVYPNPTKGTVTIETEGIESVRLINMMGQVLENRQGIRSNRVDLNLSGYAPSVYLLEIHSVYGTVKKRVTLCR